MYIIYFLPKIKLLFFVDVTFCLFSTLQAQDPGIDKPKWKNDSTIIFKSPRPLLDPNKSVEAFNNSFGGDFAFSNNGFGLGLFWTNNINKNSIK